MAVSLLNNRFRERVRRGVEVGHAVLASFREDCSKSFEKLLPVEIPDDHARALAQRACDRICPRDVGRPILARRGADAGIDFRHISRESMQTRQGRETNAENDPAN